MALEECSLILVLGEDLALHFLAEYGILGVLLLDLGELGSIIEACHLVGPFALLRSLVLTQFLVLSSQTPVRRLLLNGHL